MLTGFTAAAIAAMFALDVVTLTLVAARPVTTAIPPWVVGPDIVDPRTTLWRSSYVTNLLVLVLAVAQSPQYDYEHSNAYVRELAAQLLTACG